MLGNLQYKEIRDYLLTRKLPIDILMEVNDHFVLQIQELMREENLSFDEALTKTKASWQNELSPYWNGELDLQDRSTLLRNINRNNFWSLTKKSVSYTLPIIFFLFILSKITSFTYFKYVFVAVVFLVFFNPIVNYFRNRKEFRLFKKIQPYFSAVLIFISSFFQRVLSLRDSSKRSL